MVAGEVVFALEVVLPSCKDGPGVGRLAVDETRSLMGVALMSVWCGSWCLSG